MFISSLDYKSRIDTLIGQSESVDIAVAFWGKGASKYLGASGKRFRILCNLTSGGTNPSEIEKLLATHEVLHLDDLHAKVVIGTNLAIVGSANFSTNGLNIQEEEFDGWQEAGYGTDKADDLQGMREWFDGQWGRGVEITSDLLAQAQAVWAARFRNRISRSAPNRSVLSMSYEEVKGRNIYVAFYLDEASSEAEKVFASLKQGYELDSPKPNGAELGFFEDWDGMRQGQKVISVRVGPRGGVDVEGVYEIIDVIQKVRSKGPSKGERMTLQMCHRIVKLADRPFKKHECNEFADRLRTSGWSLSNDERYAFVPLEQLITEI